MRTGRPVAKIELSAEVTDILDGYAQRRKTAQALALRARIVLGCAAGLSNKAVAARERVTPQTVGKGRRRFVERGLDGLFDEPRPGAPRQIDDAKVESVIVQTLESQPPAATHWSTRSMARRSGISTSSVGRIWRAFGLQPHRAETFKLSQDPLFVDKVRDIADTSEQSRNRNGGQGPLRLIAGGSRNSHVYRTCLAARCAAANAARRQRGRHRDFGSGPDRLDTG